MSVQCVDERRACAKQDWKHHIAHGKSALDAWVATMPSNPISVAVSDPNPNRNRHQSSDDNSDFLVVIKTYLQDGGYNAFATHASTTTAGWSSETKINRRPGVFFLHQFPYNLIDCCDVVNVYCMTHLKPICN